METLHEELVRFAWLLVAMWIPIVASILSMMMDIARLLKEFRQWRFNHDNDV